MKNCKLSKFLLPLFLLLVGLGWSNSVWANAYWKIIGIEDWGTGYCTQDGSQTKILEANTQYEFKVYVSNWNDKYWGNEGTITGDISGWTMDKSKGNCKIKTTIKGSYVFTWDEGQKKLSVTYPKKDQKFNDIWVVYNIGGNNINESLAQDKNLGDVSEFTIKTFYLTCHDNWGVNTTAWKGGALYYNTQNSGDFTQIIAPNTDWKPSGSYEGDYQFKYEGWNHTFAGGNSGKYTYYFYGKVWGDAGDTYKNEGNNYEWKFNVLPPNVSNFAVTPSGHLGGSGTSSDPYLVKSGSQLTLTASGSKEHDDANSSLQYKFGSGSYSATTTKSITVTNTTATYITVKGKCYNSSAALSSSTESSKNIYYKAVSEPLNFISVTTSAPIAIGDEVTVTPSFKSVSGKYMFCYELWNEAGTAKISSQPTITVTKGVATFDAPATASTYTVKCNVHVGDCETTPIQTVTCSLTVVAKTTITFDANGGSFASTPSTKTAIYSQAMPNLDNGYLPTHATKDFDGFWDDETDGKQYYNDLLESVATWDKEDATKILYAHWKAKQEFSVIVKNKWGDTESTIGDPIMVGPVNPVNITGTKPYTGFVFDHWEASPENTVTFTNASSESTTIRTTAAATITAVYKTPTLSIGGAAKSYGYENVEITPSVTNFSGTAYVCYKVESAPVGATTSFETTTGNKVNLVANKMGTYTISATLRSADNCAGVEYAATTQSLEIEFVHRYQLKENNNYTTFEYGKGATSASIDKTYSNPPMELGGTYGYTYKDLKTNTEITPSKSFRYIIPGTFTFTLSNIGTNELDLTVTKPAAYVIQVNKGEHIGTLVKPSPTTIYTASGASHDIEVSNIETGYHFDNWTGPSNVTFGNATQASTTVSVSGPGSDQTVIITANAAVNTWDVTAVANPKEGGEVTGTAIGVSQITGCPVTATPKIGYYFNDWTSSNGSFTNPSALSTTFKPTAAATATANFVAYTTTIVTDKTYNAGEIVTVTPTLDIHYPNPFTLCYELWLGGEKVATQPDFDINATTGVATFAAPAVVESTYTIKAIIHDGSSCTGTTLDEKTTTLTLAPEVTYTPTMYYDSEQGTAVVVGQAGILTKATITATPNTGYAFVNWTAEPSANVTFTSATTTSTTINMTGAATITANFTPINVYLEGRARVKDAAGNETTINSGSGNWNLKLKTIPFTFNSTDGVYYLNTYCTILEQAAQVGDADNFIRMGVAQGEGTVTPYGSTSSVDDEFTPSKTEGTVGAKNGDTNDKSFKFRNVENYEDGAFARRGPVMYKYDPTNNTFGYCAPKLTLTYNGDFATMTGLAIKKDNANAVADGLTGETITYYYSTDDGTNWAEWTADIIAEKGTYQLRAVATGNNDFGQPVTNVVSNIITVTVTTPTITAAITKINGQDGSVIRINDELTITPTLQNVPAGANYTICYHYTTKPAGSAITTDVFTATGSGKDVNTFIDVEGDYTITVTLNDKACNQSGFINLATYDLNFHVKGDEITVYTKVEKSVNWADHKIYYYKGTDVGTATWPGDEMTYIGKDSADYKWYKRIITNYKQYAGGAMVFNDGTGATGLQQTVDVPMPEDDAFYYIKAAAQGGKRTTETLDPVDVTPRVILLTDTTALYQYVTIDAQGKAVFFLGDDIKYEYSVTDPEGTAVPLNSKNEFSPSDAGNYTLTITATNRQNQSETVANTFILRVATNPLTLTPSPASGTIGGTVTLTLSSTATLPSCNKTWTVIEPGSVDPVTFGTTTGTTKLTTYTTLSSGTYTYQVILQNNEGKIIGKAQTTADVAAKDMYIKYPFVNKQTTVDSDWKWVKMTYEASDGTYIYYSDGTNPSYYHSTKTTAKINESNSDTGSKDYTILNPDNVGDNTLAVFVYDLSANTVTVYSPVAQYRVKSETENGTFYSNAVSTDNADLSFFATQDGKLSWQTRSAASTGTAWTDMAEITNTVTKDAVYTAKVAISAGEPTNTLSSMTEYSGDFTVYTSLTAADAGTGSPTAANGLMTQFTKASSADYYNYYWVRFCSKDKQAAATVGNDINHNLSVALPYYLLPADANVRYGYDNTTNLFQRTFLAGSGKGGNFLQIYGENLYTATDKKTAVDKANRQTLADGSDWIYTYSAAGDVTDKQSVTATLMTNYNSTQRWILAKSGLEADADAARTILNKDVATPDVYDLRILYDYKTNRLTAGWVPTNEPTFDKDVILIDQMIIRREGDDEASKVNIQKTGGIVVVDKMTTEFALNKADEWDSNKWRDIAGDTEHRRYMFYWLSLPYKCKISEIYGMGVYGEKFEIQRYRGDLRALGQAGSNFGSSAWRKLTKTATMEANRGYVIALRLKESDFKSAEEKSYARLFFPSTESVKLAHDTVTVLPENEDSKTSNIHWDWYIMGNPLLTSGKAANLVEPTTWEQELNYVYTWDYANGDRIYTPMSLDEVTLQATHSYMVQAKGTLNWAYPTASNNAPTRTFEATEFASGDGFGVQNIRLNLMENGNQVDKTYIMYRPNGTREYEIGRDLDKIINSGCSQMYSSMNEPLASICLNSEDEEMIPLTFVVTSKTAEYTVRLNRPMNNNLVPSIYDGQTGEYKNLSFGDVTLDLVKGTNAGRYFFVLKKNGVITNTDELNGNLYDQTQKVIMNDHMFIIRDGKLYDGVGASVK